MKQFDNLADAKTLALAIVDTLPEPFVVLDDEVSTANGLRVVTHASPASSMAIAA
jgi:hypothetical protein